MTKLQELKTAIRNTPPARLAKIEYQSHFLQMIGVTIVCGILIYQGFWWIILAFIFSLGVSLSQGIRAYQTYHTIKDIVGDTYNYSKDKSPTRRREYVIKTALGSSPKYVAIFISFIICFFYVPYNTWYFKFLFTFSILFFYLVLYFFPIYWYAKIIFNIMGVKE